MTGLATVLVLIGLASAVFRSADTDPPAAGIGGGKPEVVANMTGSAIGNDVARSEPMAELGVTPTASEGNVSQARAK